MKFLRKRKYAFDKWTCSNNKKRRGKLKGEKKKFRSTLKGESFKIVIFPDLHFSLFIRKEKRNPFFFHHNQSLLFYITGSRSEDSGKKMSEIIRGLSATSEIYKGPFSEIPDEYGIIHHLLGLNIPASAFTKTPPRYWSDMRPGTCFKLLLQMITEVAARKDMGTFDWDAPILFGDNEEPRSRPRFIHSIEELVSEPDNFAPSTGEEKPRKFMSLRVSTAVFDINFDFAEGFARIMREHTNKAAQAAARPQRTNRTNQSSPDEEFLKITTIQDLVAKLWKPYLKDNNLSYWDHRSSLNEDITNKASVWNPFNILSMERLMTLHVEGVCKEQCDPNNYFAVNDGMSASTFLRKFPMPGRTFEVMGDNFKFQILMSSALPNATSLKLNSNNLEIYDKQGHLESLEQNLETFDSCGGGGDDAEEDPRRLDLEEAIYEERSDIRRIESHNAALLRNIEREEGIVPYSEQSIDECPNYDEMAKRNEFMVLRKKNLFQRDEICRRYENSAPKEFKEHYNNHRKEAIAEFETVFRECDNVTETVKTVRDYFNHLPAKDQWTENLQTVKSLSPYANMVVRMNAEFDKIFEVETNFVLLWKSFLVMLSGFRYTWDLRPNLLVTGEGGTGKSFIFDLVETIATRGTFESITHQTPQSNNTEGDHSDKAEAYHEAPINLLGMDQYGRQMAADYTLKDVLTKQRHIVKFYTFDKDTQQRIKAEICARAMKSMMMITNETVPASNTPISRRFLRHKMVQKSREDRDGFHSSFSMGFNKMDCLKRMSIHAKQLHQFYFFLWEKAIEAGALADIDLSVPKIVAQLVFDEMVNKHSIPKPKESPISMYLSICRIMTMYYGIEMEFFSELGLRHRHMDKYVDSVAKPFDFKNLLELEKWKCCTKEIAIHVLTLLEESWVPKMQSSIASAMADITNYPPMDKDKDSTSFMELDSGPGHVDYRYSQVTGPSYQQIASKIQQRFSEAPSTNDILNDLKDMMTKYVSSKNYGWFSKEDLERAARNEGGNQPPPTLMETDHSMDPNEDAHSHAHAPSHAPSAPPPHLTDAMDTESWTQETADHTPNPPPSSLYP